MKAPGKPLREKVITLLAEELLAVLWSQPMSTLKKDFCLTDKGVTKRIKKTGYPQPRRGDWQRLRAGFSGTIYPRLMPDELRKPVQIKVPEAFELRTWTDRKDYKAALQHLRTRGSLRPISRNTMYTLVGLANADRLGALLLTSPREIVQICKTHEIPLPTAQDWANLSRGRRVVRPPLPDGTNIDVMHVSTAIDVKAILTEQGRWSDSDHTFKPVENIGLPALALIEEWQRGGKSRRRVATQAGAVEALRIYDMLEAGHGDLLTFLDDALHWSDSGTRRDISIKTGLTPIEASTVYSSLMALANFHRKPVEEAQVREEAAELEEIAADDFIEERVAAFLHWMGLVVEKADWQLARDNAILLLMNDHGLSLAEAVAVQSSDLNLLRGQVTFPGRMGKPETISMSQRTILAIAKYGQAAPYLNSASLWVSASGNPFHEKTLRRALTRYFGLAKMSPFPVSAFWLPARQAGSRKRSTIQPGGSRR